METTNFDVRGGRGVREECGCQAVLGEFTACSEHEFDIDESLRIRSELLPLAEQAQAQWGQEWPNRFARNIDKPKDDPPSFLPEFDGDESEGE